VSERGPRQSLLLPLLIPLGSLAAIALVLFGFSRILLNTTHAAATVVALVAAAGILGIAAFVGMWSESYDRLWQAHLIEDVGLPALGGLDPVVWFGILGVVGTLLSIVAAAPLGRRLDDASVPVVGRTLSLLYAVLAVSSFVFALAGSLWLAVLGSYGIVVARQVAQPLFMSWLNRSVDDSSVRATTLSIVSQADAVGQWTGGPAIGALGTVTSIRIALVAATACLLPALAFLRRASRLQTPPLTGAAVEPAD